MASIEGGGLLLMEMLEECRRLIGYYLFKPHGKQAD
jgi:hypothetical protein